MTDRRRLRAVAGAAGVAAVAAAAALFFAPDAAGSVLPVEAVARSTTLSESGVRALAFGLVGVGCLLWVAAGARPARSDDDAPDPEFPAVEPSPDGVDESTVGGGFDRNLEDAVAAAGDGLDRDEARPDLRSVAAGTLAHVEGCSRTRAHEMVAAGEWTDDRVAAAYLADGEASLPLRGRLLARVRPRAAKRQRVERTVAAIEGLLEEGDRR